MSLPIEFRKLLTANREKHIYFMLSIIVTSIGFAFSITIDAAFNFISSFVFESILIWCIAAITGIQSSILHYNLLVLNEKFLVHKAECMIKNTLDDPRLDEMRVKYNNLEDTWENLMKRTYQYYVGGLVLLVIWRILLLFTLPYPFNVF
jgi:hypothetical protein